MIALVKERGLIPFMDSACQDYASGNLEEDARAMRHFDLQEFEIFFLTSSSPRTWVSMASASTTPEAKAVLSQLKMVIRLMPPPSDSRSHLVMKVLGDEARLRRGKWS